MARYINPYKRFIGSFLPNSLMRYSGVSPSAKMVWARLAQYAGEDGRCFPKISEIAGEVALSADRVKRLLYELRDDGFIEIKHPTGKDRLMHRPNEYFFIDHQCFGGVSNTTPGGGENNPSEQVENNTSLEGLKTTPPIEENQLRESKRKNKQKRKVSNHPSQPSEKFNPKTARPEWIKEGDWQDLLEHRKGKKAKNTKRSISVLLKELRAATESGFTVSACIDAMVIRNWTGFKASWMTNQAGKMQPLQQPVSQKKKNCELFYCAECAANSKNGGSCSAGNGQYSMACPTFVHLDQKLQQMISTQPDRTRMQGATPVVPAAIVGKVKGWRASNKGLWA